jgi:hypothetical protein
MQESCSALAQLMSACKTDNSTVLPRSAGQTGQTTRMPSEKRPAAVPSGQRAGQWRGSSSGAPLSEESATRPSSGLCITEDRPSFPSSTWPPLPGPSQLPSPPHSARSCLSVLPLSHAAPAALLHIDGDPGVSWPESLPFHVRMVLGWRKSAGAVPSSSSNRLLEVCQLSRCCHKPRSSKTGSAAAGKKKQPSDKTWQCSTACAGASTCTHSVASIACHTLNFMSH